MVDPKVCTELLVWFLTGDVGISSKAMASVIAQSPLGETDYPADSHPRDPSDFNRCRQLLKALPSLKTFPKEVAKLSPTWANLVEHWDELEALYVEEEPTGRCPKLYARMKALRVS